MPPWSVTSLRGSIQSVVGLSILVNASPLTVDSSLRDAIMAGQIPVAPRLDRLHDDRVRGSALLLSEELTAASALAMLVCKC